MPSDSSFAANWSSVIGTGDETVAAPASDVAANAQSAAATARPILFMFTPLALDEESYVPRLAPDLLAGKLRREQLESLDRRRIGQEIRGAGAKSFRDGAREVLPPARLAGEDVEDHEGRRVDTCGEPRRRFRLGVDERKRALQESLDLTFLPGCGEQSNGKTNGDHLEASFVDAVGRRARSRARRLSVAIVPLNEAGTASSEPDPRDSRSAPCR